MPCPITDEVDVQLFGCDELQRQLLVVLEGHGFKIKTQTDKPYETKKGKTGQYRKLKLTR